jgi:hypothetical protein
VWDVICGTLSVAAAAGTRRDGAFADSPILRCSTAIERSMFPVDGISKVKFFESTAANNINQSISLPKNTKRDRVLSSRIRV